MSDGETQGLSNNKRDTRIAGPHALSMAAQTEQEHALHHGERKTTKQGSKSKRVCCKSVGAQSGGKDDN